MPESTREYKEKPANQLLPHDQEQAALLLLRQLRVGGVTMRVTAEGLNDHGFRTRAGGLWRHQYIARFDPPRVGSGGYDDDDEHQRLT